MAVTKGPNGDDGHGRVAVLGLGTMGAPIARHLMADGFQVQAWNRTPKRPDAIGIDAARLAADPVDAVTGARAVVSALTDGAAVLEVMERASPAMSPAAVWVQTSTIAVAETEHLAGIARSQGLAFVDAPLLGSRVQALERQLVVLAGCDEEARRRAEPVLEPIARKIIWAGAAGAGTRLKLVVNTLGLALVGATAETVALAQALGISIDAVLEAVRGGPFEAPIVTSRAAMLDSGSPEVNVRLAIGLKDAGVVLQAAHAANIQLPLTDAIRTQLERADAAGLGDRDLIALHSLLSP